MRELKNIFLKNPQKLKWLIFKKISVQDLIIIFITILFCVIFYFISIALLIKIIIYSILFFICLLSITEVNETKIWTKIFWWCRYICSPKKHTPIKLKIQKHSEYIFSKKNLNFSCWKIWSKTNTLGINESQIEKMKELLKIITNKYKISIFKNKENIRSAHYAKYEKIFSNELISALAKNEIKIIDDISTIKEWEYYSIYLFVYYPSSYSSEIKKDFYFLNSLIKNTVGNVNVNYNEYLKIERKFPINNFVRIKSNRIKSKTDITFFTIKEYPKYPNFNWISNFLNDVDEAWININSCNNQTYFKHLNNAIQKLNNQQNFCISYIQKYKIQKSIHKIKQMIFQTENQKDPILEFNIICSLNYKNHKEYSKYIGTLEIIYDIKIDKLNFLQFESMNSFSPGLYDFLSKNYKCYTTCFSLSASNVIPHKYLYDCGGNILGFTHDQQLPIIFNTFKQNKTRINSNVIIFGSSGSGKSVLLKKLIKFEALKQTNIYILDIEKEYKQITKTFNGSYINYGEKESVINPLQIFEDWHNAYAQQLLFLYNLFQSLFNAEEHEIQELVKWCQITYKHFQITNNLEFSKISNDKWPTFYDVYKTWVGKSEKEGNKKINIWLNTLAFGQYSSIFCNHTNINLNTLLITFGLNKVLIFSSKVLLTAVMIIILKLINTQIIKNKNANKKTMLVIDEAWKFLDNDNLISLEFIYAQSKRIRKCNGSLVLATQNIRDLSGTNKISKYTEGIINNCQYRFYGGLKPDDLKILLEIHKGGMNELPHEVIKYIQHAKRGEFYFSLSPSESYNFKVIFTELEKELIE